MGKDVMKFDKEKSKQVIHYVIHRCGSNENVAKTVLFKILYFSDFNFYETHEKPITGEKYIKLPMGPAPKHYNVVVDKLVEDKKVKKVKRLYKDKPQHALISQREPDLSLLSANEIKIIDNVISLLSVMNASQVSAYSHGDMPWKATNNLEEIDYELVFYRDELYSVRDDNAC